MLGGFKGVEFRIQGKSLSSHTLHPTWRLGIFVLLHQIIQEGSQKNELRFGISPRTDNFYLNLAPLFILIDGNGRTA